MIRRLQRIDGSTVPAPTSFRRVWLPGVQYEGETTEQMLQRERACRQEAEQIAAEEARLIEWMLRPWWL